MSGVLSAGRLWFVLRSGSGDQTNVHQTRSPDRERSKRGFNLGQLLSFGSTVNYRGDICPNPHENFNQRPGDLQKDRSVVLYPHVQFDPARSGTTLDKCRRHHAVAGRIIIRTRTFPVSNSGLKSALDDSPGSRTSLLSLVN